MGIGFLSAQDPDVSGDLGSIVRMEWGDGLLGKRQG